MRVIFMGTPHFAVPTLQALIDSNHEVVAVYSQPPRPAGRGMKLSPSPVHQLAEAYGIPVFTPVSLKTAEAQTELAALKADIAVVAAYGLLLPQAVLDAPRLGCLNIHPSDLPRWRGAAPLQRTLMAGDTETACCIMQLELGLDTGPIHARQPYTIPPEMDAGGLHDLMAAMGAEMTLDVLASLESGDAPPPIPQSTEGVTYAEKLTKTDRMLDFNRSAKALQDQIRGLSPAPAAAIEYEGELIKIFEATLEEGDSSQPTGIALNDTLLINAGEGTALRLCELQRPGRQRQPASLVLQSLTLPKGSLLISTSKIDAQTGK